MKNGSGLEESLLFSASCPDLCVDDRELLVCASTLRLLAQSKRLRLQFADLGLVEVGLTEKLERLELDIAPLFSGFGFGAHLLDLDAVVGLCRNLVRPRKHHIHVRNTQSLEESSLHCGQIIALSRCCRLLKELGA